MNVETHHGPLNGHTQPNRFHQLPCETRSGEIARQLGGKKAQRSGNGWLTCCPAHDDQNPSLKISEGDDGKIVCHCFAGCSYDAIVAACDARDIELRPETKIRYSEDSRGNIAALLAKGWCIVETYDYTDDKGNLLYQNVRLEKRGQPKTFRQRRPHPSGKGWIENLKGVERVPYNLPELIRRSNEDIHSTEGEKDADTLTQLGFLSTSVASPNSTNLEVFRDRHVLIYEDNDDAGRRKGQTLAAALRPIAKSGRFVRFPGPRGDVTDYLNEGHTFEELLVRIEEAVEALSDSSDVQKTSLCPISLNDLLKLDIKPREFIIEPLIFETNLVMVYAWRGVGKTWFALELGYAIATGGTYLKWRAPTPRHVLHICGEMPAVDLKQRLEKIVAASKDNAQEQSTLRIVSADLHEQGVPDLAMANGQAQMDAVVGDAEVIIFDNVSTLFRTGQENDSESWVSVQNWLLKLRREGRAVIIIHHSNKAKAQRGTSKREDVLDVVLNLREPSDYEPSEGARFEVHFEKARGLTGTDAVTPFEAKLELRDGAAVWTMRHLEDARNEEIKELKKEGFTVRQIAKELKISKSTVQRSLNKKAEGAS